MTFSRLVTVLVFLGLFIMVISAPVVDSDTWWHLRSGAWITEHREILRADPFSFTRPGTPWTNPNWLAQLGLHAMHSRFGLAGLSIFTAVFVLLGLAAVWRVMEGPVLLRASVLLLVAVASSLYWSARPQIVSFALAGVFVWVLERVRGGARRLLWALPLVMVLWVNVHGGFAIGFMLIGATLVGEIVAVAIEAGSGRTWREAWALRRESILGLVATAAACLVASGLNPSAYRLLAYPFQTVSIDVLRSSIQEWQSPDFHDPRAQAYLVVVLATLLALGVSRREKRVSEMVVLIGFFFFGFLAWRNIPLACLVAAPSLSRHAASAGARLSFHRVRGKDLPERVTRRLNVTLLVLLAILAIMQLRRALDPAALRLQASASVPAKAVEVLLDAQAPRELFHSYDWGGYLLWAAYPAYPTFVDGRTDIFEDGLLREYVRAWNAQPGWQGILDRWGIRSALIEPEAPLTAALTDAGWTVEYRDEQAVLLTR